MGNQAMPATRERPNSTRSGDNEAARPHSSLTVGRVDDPAEAEADRFADGLLSDLTQRPMAIRRVSSAAMHDELGGTSVDSTTASRIHRASGGRALPSTLRLAAEERSGRDLSEVRVHSGSEAASLSDDLQATAFTVGSDVFLGTDAARPGTSSGDALLGHEIGHVVQQGGGVASRAVQRQPKLAPLRSGGTPTVQRLFGKKKPKKSKLEQVNDAAQSSQGATVVTIRDLEGQIKLLESALGKLLAQHTGGNAASQAAANGLQSAAERILGNLPDQGSKASKVLGRTYPVQVRRLQRIIDETQLIWDEHLVQQSKAAAGQIYQDAALAKGSGRPGALTQLSTSHPFQALGDRPDTVDPTAKLSYGETPQSKLESQQERYDNRKAVRDHGASVGLSGPELAAIITFTGSDYRYINPATANNRAWMIGANEANDSVDKPNLDGAEKIELQLSLQKQGITMDQRLAQRNKELGAMTEEGALHAGMAMQGLLKMPVYKGQLYRGECVTKADFDKRFTIGKRDKVTPVEKTLKRLTISSASKDRGVATAFQGIASAKIAPPRVYILWEMDVTNGRDIEAISAATAEREVATLPGAEFAVVSATMNRPDSIVVKCKQRK